VIDPADVTAVIPTRGDVPLGPILRSLIFDHVIVWNNSLCGDHGALARWMFGNDASAVYTQDDDCLVPADAQRALCAAYEPGLLVSNMNPGHNAGMPHLALPGWGAVFDPFETNAAAERWADAEPGDHGGEDWMRIGCDIVIPTLCRSVMLDLGHENLPYAWDGHRTHLQHGYHDKKRWYYQRACELRP
jgi:hypothetical protein